MSSSSLEATLLQRVDTSLCTAVLLKQLRLRLSQLLNPNTKIVFTNTESSSVVNELCAIIETHQSDKDVVIVCFICIQKVLVLSCPRVEQFLADFLLLTDVFGFERNQEILNNCPPNSELSVRSEFSLFVKLIFLREFVTGKDPIVLNFLFSDYFHNSIIYQFFLKQLLSLYTHTNISLYIHIFCHALIQWLDTALLFFKHIPYNTKATENIFDSKYELSSFINDFVWRFIEEGIPGLSENSRIILQKYFKLHHWYTTWTGRESAAFFKHFLNNTLELPWTSKARYILLHSISEFVSPGTILKYKQLPDQLCKCLSTTNLYTPASEVYRALIKDISLEQWISTWLHPFLHSLLSTDHNERHHLTQYWLPATLKSIPTSSQLIMDSLYAIATHNKSPISTLLDFKISIDFVQDFTPTYNSLLYASIHWLKYSIAVDRVKLTTKSVGFLREGLISGDEDIRIEAIHVLLTVPFDSSHVWRADLIRVTFPLNLNPPYSPFRQKLGLLVSKSITNIQAMLIDKIPKEDPIKFSEQFQQENIKFIQLLCFYKSKSLQCLLPDSPFQKVSLGLSIYQSLLDSFIRPVETKKSNSKSRQAKLNLYALIAPVGFGLLVKSDLVAICTCLNSDYFEIRELAIALITPHLSNTNTTEAIGIVFPSGLESAGKRMLTSSRVYDGETGALLLRLHLANSIENVVYKSPMEHYYKLSVDLLSLLAAQFVSAKKNILEASHTAPLFSAITAVNSVLNHAITANPTDFTGLDWGHFLNNLISLLDDVTTFCLSTLTGYASADNEEVLTPSFADMGVAIETAVLATQPDNEETERSVHHTDCSSISYQLVLNCVWLALREICCLLGGLPDVFGMVETSQLSNCMQVLTCDVVERVGSILIGILTRCRHVGAILSCQSALHKFCYSICCSSIPSIRCLTSQWLHSIVSTITSRDTISSISRQGAGFPLCVQSIVSSESKLTHKALLQFAVEQMLTHSSLDSVAVCVSDTHDLVPVRCMNVLRALFKDSTIGNGCVLSYGERGLSLAVGSMRSSSWAVRNAGMMLFGALAVKMLGQRRLTDETSELNTITVRQLFTRFPSTVSLFLSQLSSAPDCTSTDLHAAVYPVLLFLSKLCPSPQYKFTQKSSYIRILQKYIQSPVYSVRCKASQSLAMFLYSSNMAKLLLHVIGKIPSSVEQCVSNNYVHGQLLLVEELIRLAYVLYGTGGRSVLQKVYEYILCLDWLFSRETPLVIRNAFFSIICMLTECITNHQESIELNVNLLRKLSEDSNLDISNLNLTLSVVSYYILYIHRTPQLVREELNTFIGRFFNTFIASHKHNICDLCNGLLQYHDVLAWLSTSDNSTFVSLFRCIVESAGSLAGSDISCVLEVLLQMLADIKLDSTEFSEEFNLLTNCLLSSIQYDSIQLELCSLQLASSILICGVVNTSLLNAREIELVAFLTELIGKHCEPDSAEDSRMIAGDAITSLLYYLTLSPYTLRPSLFTFLFVVISKIILLLQDELVEVRNSVAKEVSKVFNFSPLIDAHFALKMMFYWLSKNLAKSEESWELLLTYVSYKNTINSFSVTNESVLFEKGKDNIYGEDCVNCEFAFKSLHLISRNLHKTKLYATFIQFLLGFVKAQPPLPSATCSDITFVSNALLFKRFSGVLCLSKLLELAGEKAESCCIYYQQAERSYLLRLYLEQIEVWIQDV